MVCIVIYCEAGTTDDLSRTWEQNRGFGGVSK